MNLFTALPRSTWLLFRMHLASTAGSRRAVWVCVRIRAAHRVCMNAVLAVFCHGKVHARMR